MRNCSKVEILFENRGALNSQILEIIYSIVLQHLVFESALNKCLRANFFFLIEVYFIYNAVLVLANF